MTIVFGDPFTYEFPADFNGMRGDELKAVYLDVGREVMRRIAELTRARSWPCEPCRTKAAHTRTGHPAVGWLVVEDLFTVLVLVLLPAVFARGGGAGRSAGDRDRGRQAGIDGWADGDGGKRAIPWLLDRSQPPGRASSLRSPCSCWRRNRCRCRPSSSACPWPWTHFLAGMVVGRSEFSLRAATEALPMRDAFAVLFFVSVGMLFDPRHLIEFPALVAITCAIVLASSRWLPSSYSAHEMPAPCCPRGRSRYLRPLRSVSFRSSWPTRDRRSASWTTAQFTP